MNDKDSYPLLYEDSYIYWVLSSLPYIDNLQAIENRLEDIVMPCHSCKSQLGRQDTISGYIEHIKENYEI